jgi:ligand-binding sensor domain-containing protein
LNILNLPICKPVILSFLFFISVSAQTINSEIFLNGASVTGISMDDGSLWVSTYGQGVYSYSFKESKWINFSTKNANLDNDFFYTIEVNKNYVWAGAADGLFIYNKLTNRWTTKKFVQGGQFGNWIRSLKYDPAQNVLWIGRFRFVTRYDLAARSYADIDRMQGKDQKSNNIKSISLDGDSLIWFGTESGVHIYNKKKKFNNADAWKYLTNKNRGFNEEGEAVSVSDILPEADKVWFGTDEFVTAEQPEFNLGGIYSYDRIFFWNRISKIDGLDANGIYALGKSGNYIWTGIYEFDKIEKQEYGKGLYLINRLTGKLKKVDLNQLDISSSSILCFLFDGINMWVGTGDGLLKIKIENKLAEWLPAKTKKLPKGK